MAFAFPQYGFPQQLNEIIICLLILLIIFAIAFEIFHRFIKFSKMISGIIAIVVTLYVSASGEVLRLMHLILAMGITARVAIFIGIIALAFIFFLLGIRPFRYGPRR